MSSEVLDTMLKQKIEPLRWEMIHLVKEKGNLADESVVALAQQLDKHLIVAQQLMRPPRNEMSFPKA
ncbi:hypothetical protein DNHGIG_13700 [Collibacillus ludicampi]|jgi:hypothetical protein|uniref:Spo0E like sporulation regulatory protein n=1 Tax=Collibacillus ludicampi TaxID=2771369 RepID=A0AAV4LDM1_9BACL|nr:aspartyl-phosphate phosphatase Spo0E family protein [Collibacillus ludicampi]GIM45821.1 hypothetical protein DNHGIG_13700 [Collibacillus ludicampi]